VPVRKLISVVLALFVVAAPAAAWADGAGDEQYQDPLTAPATPKKAKKKVASAPVASAPTTSSAPASSAAPAEATPAPSAPAAANELPRTGAPAGLICLSGATLILAGTALRRRTAPR
jgi:hypothetical protein